MFKKLYYNSKNYSNYKNTAESSDGIIDSLKTLRLKYLQNPVIAQINISSIRNKFETLVSVVTSDIDILKISETKIDESFPLSQLHFRFDRNAHGGGILWISEIILQANC